MIEEIKIDRLEELIQEMMRKIRDTYPTETREGNPITFDNGGAAPLVKCITEIHGSQSGSGTPSPENVRPIVAYNQSTISVEDENGVVQQTSTATFTNSIYQGNADFIGSGSPSVVCVRKYIEIDENYSSLSFVTGSNLLSISYTGFSPITSDNITQYICNRLNAHLNANAASMSNEFTVDGNNNLLLKVPGMTSLADYKTWLESNHLQFVGLLAAPTRETITPTNLPIKSLSGYNHIESSTGDMEVTYITEEFEALAPRS